MGIIEETRVKLAIMGAKDIKKLENDANFLIFWRHTRTKIGIMLREGSEDINEIGDNFTTFEIDMWSNFPWAYITERRSLVIRLWSLLFCSIFELCGGLVHEYSHYRYLMNNNLLDKSEIEQERHKPQMEVIANERQFGFLQRAKKYVGEKITVTMPEQPHFEYSRDEIIKQCELHLRLWKKSKNYSNQYEQNVADTAKRNYETIAQRLKINLNDLPRKNVASTKIRFWL